MSLGVPSVVTTVGEVVYGILASSLPGVSAQASRCFQSILSMNSGAWKVPGHG